MTVLNDYQEQLLTTVRDTYADLAPVLKKLEEDYEYAVYMAKKPIREAVEQAREERVPLSRITQATDLPYPQKLKAWLRPSDSVVDRLLSTEPKEKTAGVFEGDLKQVQTVSRDPSTGVFTVHYDGREHKVNAVGPDTEPWAAVDSNIPEGVYNLITEKYPGFVALPDEDDDEDY